MLVWRLGRQQLSNGGGLASAQRARDDIHRNGRELRRGNRHAVMLGKSGIECNA